jgi:hypothetical protein
MNWGSALGAIDCSQSAFRAVTVFDCDISAVYRGIVQSNKEGRVVAMANDISDVDQQAIRVTGQGGYVGYNVINPQGGSGDGLYVRAVGDGSSRASFYTFESNYIYDCDAGIEVQIAGSTGGLNNTFRDNHIDNCTFGYDVRNTTYTRIIGGSIRNVGFIGIQVGNEADETTIRNVDNGGSLESTGSLGKLRLWNYDAGISGGTVYINGVLEGGYRGGADLTAVTGEAEGDLAMSDGTATGFPQYSLAVWDDANSQWVRVDGQATV